MTEDNKDTIKNGFFRKVLKSIKDFDKYEDFALEKPADALKYLVKLVAIFCVIICTVYTYKIVDNMNNIYTGIKDKIPDFNYENGELITQTEEPTIIEDYSETIGTIIIDTKEDVNIINEKYYNEYIKKYGTGLVFSKENLIVYSPQINGQLIYKYSNILSNYQIENITKQEMIDNIENLNIISIYFSIYVIMYVYLFILYFISIMMDVLILTILAYIISRFSRIRFKFAPSFNVAIHSITLPVILNLIYIVVNLFTGFEVKYFQLMYNTISYIYVIVAILMIKTDFINRQVELIKLAQEQEKIKEELKKQEENKEQEEKNKEEDKNSKEKDKESKNKKEQKKKSKKDSDTEEPLGNATITENQK